jgi:hypothetical protein
MAHFQTKKSKFGKTLEGLAMEDVGILYGRLVYFTAIWYTLWPFGKFFGYLVYFSLFGKLDEDKSGNPEPRAHTERPKFLSQTLENIEIVNDRQLRFKYAEALAISLRATRLGECSPFGLF